MLLWQMLLRQMLLRHMLLWHILWYSYQKPVSQQVISSSTLSLKLFCNSFACNFLQHYINTDYWNTWFETLRQEPESFKLHISGYVVWFAAWYSNIDCDFWVQLPMAVIEAHDDICRDCFNTYHKYNNIGKPYKCDLLFQIPHIYKMYDCLPFNSKPSLTKFMKLLGMPTFKSYNIFLIVNGSTSTMEGDVTTFWKYTSLLYFFSSYIILRTVHSTHLQVKPNRALLQCLHCIQLSCQLTTIVALES